jgi:hypothetical protein
MRGTKLGQKSGTSEASAEGSTKILKLVPQMLVDLSKKEEKSLDLSKFFLHNFFRIRDKTATAKLMLKIAFEECEEGQSAVSAISCKKQQSAMPSSRDFLKKAASYISLAFDILVALEHESEDFQPAMLRHIAILQATMEKEGRA